MSELCPKRQSEEYEVCSDKVVSKCALRDKKEALRFPRAHKIIVLL